MYVCLALCRFDGLEPCDRGARIAKPTTAHKYLFTHSFTHAHSQSLFMYSFIIIIIFLVTLYRISWRASCSYTLLTQYEQPAIQQRQSEHKRQICSSKEMDQFLFIEKRGRENSSKRVGNRKEKRQQ